MVFDRTDGDKTTLETRMTVLHLVSTSGGMVKGRTHQRDLGAATDPETSDPAGYELS